MSNNKQSSVDAYCNSCDAFICDALVTFEETCSNCGTQIEYFENEMSNNKKSNDYIPDVGKMVSSIEFIKNNLERLGMLDNGMVITNIFEQAEAMQENEYFEVFKAGQDSMEEGGKGFEQYYNETFGGNNDKEQNS